MMLNKNLRQQTVLFIFLLVFSFSFLLIPSQILLEAATRDCCMKNECSAGTQCVGANCSYTTQGGITRTVGTKGKCLSEIGGPCDTGADCIGGTGNNKTASCVQKAKDPAAGKICKGLDVAVTSTKTKQPRLAIPDLKLNIPFGSLDKAFAKPQTVIENGKKFLVIPWLAIYVGEIYKYALGIVTLLAVLMIMIGGIVWLTAGGSPEKVSNAKKYINGAVIGLLLTLFSYLILFTINPALVKFEPLKVQLVEYVDTEESKECDNIPAPDMNKCTGLKQIVPSEFLNIGSGVIAYMQPPAASSLINAAQCFGSPLTVNSMFRSREKQECLYKEKCLKPKQEGKACLANKPGTSTHEDGRAVDINVIKMSDQKFKKLLTCMESNNFKNAGKGISAASFPKNWKTIKERWHFTYQGGTIGVNSVCPVNQNPQLPVGPRGL